MPRTRSQAVRRKDHSGKQGQGHNKEHLRHARIYSSGSGLLQEITTEKGSTTTAHPMQGDHNTRTGERHCSSNARRSQHQDWRKAQPPLLIQCKEITTPGLEKGSTTTAHPMQGDHNTMQDWKKAQPPLAVMNCFTPCMHGNIKP